MESDMEDGLLKLCWNNHQSTFSHVISTLREQERLSDATLACDGHLYSVHKLILSVCSDYFASMLDGTPCEHPVIVLQDVLPEDLESLLSYMYEGTVSVSQSALGRLIKTAEMLRIKGLAVAESQLEEENVQSNKRERPSSSICQRSESSSPSPMKRRRRTKAQMQREQVTDISAISAPMIPIMAEDVTAYIKSEPECSDLEFEDCGEQNQMLDEKKDGSQKDFLSDLNEMLAQAEVAQPDPLPTSVDDSSEKADSPGPLQAKNENDTEIDTTKEFLIGDEDEKNLDIDNSIKPGFGTSSSAGGDVVKYRCCSCTFGSNDATQFILHLRAHQESIDKPFRCHYCPYSTSARRNLIAHERTHTGEKPFQCKFCPYTASMPHHVKRHERTHTGEKPYKCALCPYMASQKSSLDNHEKTKHQLTLNVDNIFSSVDGQI